MEELAKKAKLKRLKSSDDTKVEWARATINDVELDSDDSGDEVVVYEQEDVVLEGARTSVMMIRVSPPLLPSMRSITHRRPDLHLNPRP